MVSEGLKDLFLSEINPTIRAFSIASHEGDDFFTSE
jgi:hypothetical protein